MSTQQCIEDMIDGKISEYWAIVKNLKSRPIREPKLIDKYLDRGFTVVHVKSDKGTTNIKTYSPLTYSQYVNKHRSVYGNLPC